jgi:hypothetical protein
MRVAIGFQEVNNSIPGANVRAVRAWPMGSWPGLSAPSGSLMHGPKQNLAASGRPLSGSSNMRAKKILAKRICTATTSCQKRAAHGEPKPLAKRGRHARPECLAKRGPIPCQYLLSKEVPNVQVNS